MLVCHIGTKLFTVSYYSIVKRFIAQTVYTSCSVTCYKIVPLTNLNNYLHYDTSEKVKCTLLQALK